MKPQTIYMRHINKIFPFVKHRWSDLPMKDGTIVKWAPLNDFMTTPVPMVMVSSVACKFTIQDKAQPSKYRRTRPKSIETFVVFSDPESFDKIEKILIELPDPRR